MSEKITGLIELLGEENNKKIKDMVSQFIIDAVEDDIRDYNNHASMNKEQGGFLNVSAQTAGYIKNISQKNTFFKNCGKFTDNNVIKGQ